MYKYCGGSDFEFLATALQLHVNCGFPSPWLNALPISTQEQGPVGVGPGVVGQVPVVGMKSSGCCGQCPFKRPGTAKQIKLYGLVALLVRWHN